MKVYGYLALTIIIVGAIYGGLRWAHSSGYNERDQEVQQEIIDAQESARLEEEARWAEAVAAAEAQIITEEKIVERIRYVEKEIPTVVREIVELKPECRNLGPAYARLLNDQVRASNRVSDPQDRPGPVEGVP